MIFFSIGLPSQFALWCDRLITKLVGLSGADTAAIEANSLEEIAAGAIRTAAAHLVICARQPGNQLQSEIVGSGHPFVITLADPRTVVHRLLGAGGELAGAARLVASGCAGLRALTTAPNALVLAGSPGADPVATAKLIADHLGLRISAHEISSAVGELAEGGITPGGNGGAPLPDATDERTRAVVDGAVLPYIAHLDDGADLEPLVWERELFYLSEDPPAAVPVNATRPVDLTGRPRALIYGPRIVLPPGNWRANVVLAFSPETAGMSFLVEICAGLVLNQTRVTVGSERVIVAELRFAVAAATDETLELHVQSERAAFDGQIGLGHVTLTREPEPAAPPQDLAAS